MPYWQVLNHHLCPCQHLALQLLAILHHSYRLIYHVECVHIFGVTDESMFPSSPSWSVFQLLPLQLGLEGVFVLLLSTLQSLLLVVRCVEHSFSTRPLLTHRDSHLYLMSDRFHPLPFTWVPQYLMGRDDLEAWHQCDQEVDLPSLLNQGMSSLGTKRVLNVLGLGHLLLPFR